MKRALLRLAALLARHRRQAAEAEFVRLRRAWINAVVARPQSPGAAPPAGEKDARS